MSSHDVNSVDTTFEATQESTKSSADTASLSLVGSEGLAETKTKTTAAVLTACRSALVRSPAASLIALTRHQTLLDSKLMKALEVVGGYDIAVNPA